MIFFLLASSLVLQANIRNCFDYPGAALPNNSITLSVPSNQICSGQEIKITLSSSEVGVSYQLYAGVTAMGNPMQGTGSSIFFLISPTATATYLVRATNSDGTVDLANQVIITVNSALNLNYIISKNIANPICETHSDFVTLTLSGSETGVTYKLIDDINIINNFTGNGAALNLGTYSPLEDRTYRVFAEKPGCYLQDTLFINDTEFIDVVPLPDTSFDLQITEDEICIGESTQVSMIDTELGTNYTLKFGSTTIETITGTGEAMSFASGTPPISQNYTVVANNPYCDIDQTMDETISLMVGLTPDIDIFPSVDDDMICLGEEITVSLETTNSTVGYQLYVGSTAIGDPIMGNEGKIDFPVQTPQENTTYSFKAQGEYCVNQTDLFRNIDVVVHYPPQTDRILSSDKDTICKGEEVRLKIDNSQADIFYQLHDGTNLIGTSIMGTGGTIYFADQTLNENKTYSLRAHESVCTTKISLPASKTIQVLNFDSAPIESIATPDEICMGSEIAIELPTTVSGVEYVLENNGIEVESITSSGDALVFEDLEPDMQTNYRIRIGNCEDEVIVAEPEYTIHTNPQLQIMKNDVTTGYNGSISVTINYGTPPFTYFLNPLGSSTSESRVKEYTQLKQGTYTLLVVDSEACRSSESGEQVVIALDESKKVVVNNAITPNNDGINDTWMIHYQPSLGTPEVYVFNIYGQEVYHSKAYQNDWNGEFKGEKLPNGAYYYLIEFKNGDHDTIKGSLSILGNY